MAKRRGPMNCSPKKYRRARRARIGAAAVMPLLLAAPAAYADYVFTGPDDGQWTVPANWTYVYSDPPGNPPPPNQHVAITYYPGRAGTDTTVTTNINSHVTDGSAHVIFDPGVGVTAEIGRLYVGSNNSGPG